MTVTREDLKTCHMEQAMHYHGTGTFGYIFRCIEHPRLSRNDRYLKKDRSVTSTWRVDGEDCADLDAAVLRLAIPANFTLEEKAALDLVPTDFTRVKTVSDVVGVEMMFALREKGAIEYGKDMTPPEGGWSDWVPEHLRSTPTVRRRPE